MIGVAIPHECVLFEIENPNPINNAMTAPTGYTTTPIGFIR